MTKSEFERALEAFDARIAAHFDEDHLVVVSEPRSSDGEKVRAFLLVAASVAAEAGMDADEFVGYARAFASRAAALHTKRSAGSN